jgi:hypothetical protein
MFCYTGFQFISICIFRQSMENFETEPESHREITDKQKYEEVSQKDTQRSKRSQGTTSALETLLEDIYINDVSSAKVSVSDCFPIKIQSNIEILEMLMQFEYTDKYNV